MSPSEVLKESVTIYLEKKLLAVESELFRLGKKYGVKDIFELDKKIKEGVFAEKDTFEDYFYFDNLEAERQRLKALLKQVDVQT
ncbi:MAG: hypothetical protein D6778_10830 [Nitrospirae bacterium]|nr:MAG: hypothetical protein D6778_10830 [Nitrospirota bacterium]